MRDVLATTVHALDHDASLSALEISVSVAFSASLTGTPPMPRNPPSFDASATCWLIWRNQPLKAAASAGALASITAPACRSVSMHLALIPRRPRLAARPPLQIARPAALLGGLRQGSYDKVVTGGEQTLKLAPETLRDGSGSALLGTLALAVAVGLLVGRRLTDHRTVRRTL